VNLRARQVGEQVGSVSTLLDQATQSLSASIRAERGQERARPLMAPAASGVLRPGRQLATGTTARASCGFCMSTSGTPTP
jgi:hypothetical protein